MLESKWCKPGNQVKCVSSNTSFLQDKEFPICIPPTERCFRVLEMFSWVLSGLHHVLLSLMILGCQANGKHLVDGDLAGIVCRSHYNWYLAVRCCSDPLQIAERLQCWFPFLHHYHRVCLMHQSQMLPHYFYIFCDQERFTDKGAVQRIYM